MKKEKLVIFGTGDIAQIANYYFSIDSDYEVAGFCVDQEFLKESTFEGKPLVAFEEVEKIYPPDNYKMFIALSYSQMNRLRESKFNAALAKGYALASYVSSRCTNLTQFPIGRNCFIFEDNTIQPFVQIGDNVTLWSGNHIGHHSVIESHNFVSSHVVISGHCVLKSYSFIGVNSTIGHNVTIGSDNIIGAGAVITKNTEPFAVYVPAKSAKLEKPSSEFKL